MFKRFALSSAVLVGVAAHLSVAQGQLFSDGFESSTPTIVTSVTTLAVNESATAALNVQLSRAPSQVVTVTVTRSSGDLDLRVTLGATLAFSPSNWDQNQLVEITADADADSDDGSAQFTLSGSGLNSATVTVNEVDDDSGTGQSSALINDTGIMLCTNLNTNGLLCPVTGFPNQDGENGRDVTDNNFSDGAGGFSFQKRDANGNEVSASTSQFACVEDNVTELIWEAKTDNGGLQDPDHTYSWRNTSATTNGGNSGAAGGGQCSGSTCDTESFVAATNASSLCGFSNWRMPTAEELRSIVDYSRSSPAIDSNLGTYFQNTLAQPYWTATPDQNPDNNSSNAWSVNFDSGSVSLRAKSTAGGVRLVRDR